VPRHSSRLILAEPDLYVSIVDKAILRKQKLNDTQPQSTRSPRRGELDADDLLAVAIEDGSPLPTRDIVVLAEACDLTASDLGLDLFPSSAISP
jgi:hypothetical protein